MDRLRSGFFCGAENLFDVKVALRRRRGADGDGLVAGRNVGGMCIGLRIDRNRTDAHAAKGAGDAAGDSAAVGNENFGEHWRESAFECWQPVASGRYASPCGGPSQISTSIGVGL